MQDKSGTLYPSIRTTSYSRSTTYLRRHAYAYADAHADADAEAERVSGIIDSKYFVNQKAEIREGRSLDLMESAKSRRRKESRIRSRRKAKIKKPNGSLHASNIEYH